MSKDLNRQKQLFEAALEQDPSVRAAWLRRACDDDEELFVTVWELLESHAAAGSFLATPEAMVQRQLGLPATTPPAPNTEQPGQWVGGYKLLEPLGEGGFGIVWMAQQEQPVRRLVALKVLKAGMDSAQVVARFEQERQALAVMQHPHIAQVFDAGVTSAGRPFFVMELVKGVPINDYCARERLSVPARLQLFVQVCRAVQHAHGKGVIHRDIKPRNVLVATHDGKPLAKVIDFGIAKATGARLTERTLFTEHRAMVGTLEYMSPEQAEGLLDIDTRADVYSLGALLYELLTGGTPFDSRRLLDAGMAELLRALREDEPQRPSLRVSSKAGAGWAGGAGRAIAAVDEKALFGALRGDLDWVVMKALEKDRGRRYASADGLAEDVERYLAGDAVLAVPPSVGYRVRKFVRRHRAAVVSAAIVASLVLVGGGLLFRAWGQQAAEQRQAVLAREEERFASYGNAVRAGVENSDLGNRARGLAGLDSCEVGLRDWEWRHARARAEDTVRFTADRCRAWGASGDGKRVAWMEDGALWLLDTETWVPKCLWRGEWKWPSTGSRLFVSADHRVILVLPELLGFEDSVPAEQLVAAFGIETGEWRYRETFRDGTMVAVDTARDRMVTWDAQSQVICFTLTNREVVWQRQVPSPKPIDLIFSALGDVVVCLTGVDAGQQCIGLQVANGDAIWSKDVPPLDVPHEDGSTKSHQPSRVFLSPRVDKVCMAAPEHVDNLGRDYMPAAMIDCTTSDVFLGQISGLPMFYGWATGLRDALERGPGDPPNADIELRRIFLGTQELVKTTGIHTVSSGSLAGIVKFTKERFALCMDADPLGDRDTDVRRKLGLFGALYAGGSSDVALQTLEWRTQPRRFAGVRQHSLGASGLAIAIQRDLLLAFPHRAHDVFPPRPLGFTQHVASLGLWRDQPAAIYRGGITTLDCDESVRLPTDDSPFPIDAASSDRSGALLAIASNTNLRVIATADGRDARPAIPIQGKVRALALAPEGRHVVAILEGDDKALALHVFTADSSASVASRPLPSPPDVEPAFVLSATSDRLALAGGHAPLRLFALPSLDEIRCDPAAAHPATSVQFAPDGDRLAVGRLDGRVDILRRDGSVGPRFAAHSEAVSAFAWTQNGTRLFTAGGDGFVRIWEPTKGVELLNLGDNSVPGQPGMRAFDGLPNCLFATPDGERLFCGYDDGAVRVWDTVPWLERVARRKAREASAPQQPK